MLFSIVAVPTYIPIYGAQSFPFLHILTNASYFFFMMKTTLTGVRWYLIMVLICTSLKISLFSYHCWHSV